MSRQGERCRQSKGGEQANRPEVLIIDGAAQIMRQQANGSAASIPSPPDFVVPTY
jgi:hypothetical protein